MSSTIALILLVSLRVCVLCMYCITRDQLVRVQELVYGLQVGGFGCSS